MKFYDTLVPYATCEHNGIQYSVCREFSHISRYKGLRQVIHNPNDISDRFIALETSNPFETQCEVIYYTVPNSQINRLDLIAAELLGSASYSWIIAYFNGIEDGFTVRESQKLMIPKSISSLFAKGEVLASVSAFTLHLGEE